MSSNATFSDDPYQHVLSPLNIEDINQMNRLGLAVNHEQQTGMNYGRSKSGNGSIQLYRRLNPRGRNITVRIEGSMGDNQNRNVSNSCLG